MPITENLMGAGSFQVTLQRGTRLSIRQAVPYNVQSGGLDGPYGHIVITKQRLADGTPSAADVIAQARFSGRISRRSNKMHTFGGEGIGVWLGDSNGVGKFNSAITANRTWQQWIHAAITLQTTGSDGNGLTEGTYTNPIASPVYNGTIPAAPNRAMIDLLAGVTGNEWRVTPQGAFESGNPTTFWRNTPNVVVHRGGTVRDPGGLTGLEAVTLEVEENFDDYRDYVIVTGQGGASGFDYIPSTFRTWGGAFFLRSNADLTSDSTDNTACTNTATSYLNVWSKSQKQITCQVRSVFDPRRLIQPGDSIFVFDPETGMTDNTQARTYGGRTITPVVERLMGMTYPIMRGMGVYSIQTQDASNSVVDLTDSVEWETGPIDLQIGRRRLNLFEVVSGHRTTF